MKKFLKWSGIVILGIVILLFVTGWILSEPLPEGKNGSEADALAEKILTAIDQPAWDTTNYVSWNFGDRHHLLWDRDRKLVQVEWPDHKVLLNTQNQEGKAWKDGQILDSNQAQDELDKAWKYFCNDSFWLVAPGKVYDPGTSRKAVELEDGTQGLLISYSSGGVTPGDSYLWVVNDEGLPVKWKMWVSMIPIGGIEGSWEDWKALATGAKVATLHKIGFYELEIKDVKAGNAWEHVGLQDDPFAPLF